MEKQKIPKLQHLIDYLNLNKHLLENEYNQFPVQKIMLMLDNSKLKCLEKQFNNYPTGLQLPSFLFIMKEILKQDCFGDQKYFLIDGLIQLFHCIDINGDGHMLWQQFTEYIIQAIHKNDKPISQNKNYLQKQIIQSAYSKFGREYKFQKNIDLNIQNNIKKGIYINKMSSFAFLQKNSNIIKIYDSDFQEKQVIEIKVQKSYYHIIDFDFDQQNFILGVIVQNSTVLCNFKLTKPKNRYIKYFKHTETQNFHKICYLPKHKYWAFSTPDGEIKLFSAQFKSRSNPQLNFVHSIKHHTAMVTMIKQIFQPQLICSCSLDGSIKLFSMINLRSLQFDDHLDHKNSVIDSKAKKGYLGIDYSQQFGNYLLVFGFSSQIYIYCLDISLTKGYNNKYVQHTSQITYARFIKGYPYILSIDQRSCIRIWNFKNYKTNQLINAIKIFSNTYALLVVPELNSFFICDRKIIQFKTLSFYKKSKQINKFHRLIDFYYNPYINSLYIFTSNDIRRYDGLTGRLKQLITNLSDEKYQFIITAGQFGPKCRKIYIGDAAGYLRQYLAQTGQFLGQIKPIQEINQNHSKEIKKLLFVKEEDLLICTSVDSRILIYLRNDLNQYHIIRDIRGSHTSELTCAAYSHWFSKFATGCQSGTVNIWNSEKYLIQAVLIISNNKIIDIAFLKNFPVIFIGTDIGQIFCYGLKQIQDQSKRYRCIFKITNQINQIKIPLTCFCLQTKKFVLNNKELQLIKNKQLIRMLENQDSHLILVIGNINGTINLYFLDLVFSQYNIHLAQKIQGQQIIKYKKYDHIYIDKIVQAFINRRNLLDDHTPSPQIKIQKIFYKTWQAFPGHKVEKIKIFKQPFLIMSSGSDQKFKIWDLNGKNCGSINFETFRNNLWKIPQINIKRKLEQIDFVLYSLKLIQEEVELSQDKIEKIKCRILMSKYINQKELKNLNMYLKKIDSIQYADKIEEQKGKKQIHHNFTFEEDYESIVKKLRDRLVVIQNQMNQNQSMQLIKKNNVDTNLKKKNQYRHKQLKYFQSKLEAIESGLTEQSTFKKYEDKKNTQIKKIRQNKSVNSKSQKNLFFISCSQLKKNLKTIHRLLKPISHVR